MLFFGLPILVVLGLVFKGYRFIKITEDLVTICRNQPGAMILSIAFHLFTLFLAMQLYDGWFLTIWTVLWINLVIWFRTIRYVPILVIRYVIVIIPFTLLLDALLSDSILGEFAGTVMDIPTDVPETGTHFVNPHEVSGYTKQDGTVVEGYYRDGDGEASTKLSKEESGGYGRSNPDGNPSNNLNA
ncbi:hypothetical protein [Neobacillus sp. OS1-33]|uniref:hypothetical protein n=1 Tax=Neobacillus sp. OS1-33 TaxID=3070683 RepID=UPI0027E0590C|nr:hypothetical protein [Neobacillus sp. OS1-33]WML24120.1 hypothetical protein RCG22_14255 [Neobacillus sp. OS1-33]